MAYGDPVANIGTDPWDFTEFQGMDSVDLLARLIYSEARGEQYVGKQGVGWVALNRRNKNITEFGGGTFAGVILKRYQFSGMTTVSAREPDVGSQAWSDSLYIASNISSQYNPIGTCLWFNANSMYSSRTRIYNGKEQYTFDGGSTYKDVVEKVVLGGQTFFRVAGY